jgi:ribosome-associated translation inhibitor RaiA
MQHFQVQQWHPRRAPVSAAPPQMPPGPSLAPGSAEEARRMQPVVRDDASHFDRQTRAYAEFRVFSRLAAERGAVASAVVTLRRVEGPSVGDTRTRCRITIVTADGATLDVTASEPHPYAAIDGAVARVEGVLRMLRRGDDRSERESA